jgi:AmmeMemoRadiSam system protein A
MLRMFQPFSKSFNEMFSNLSNQMGSETSSELSGDDRAALIEIARRAISSAVIENTIPDCSSYPAALNIHRGVFVSLYSLGNLRGCMGQVENPGPLAELVAHTAVHAALHDPRFPPVGVNEVPTLGVEISVLSPLKPIAADGVIAGHLVGQHELCQHGLMVTRDRCKGLLLPQVATERQWSRQRFLEETCAKAGLPRNAWQDSATQVFAFTAEVFSDAALQSGNRA